MWNMLFALSRLVKSAEITVKIIAHSKNTTSFVIVIITTEYIFTFPRKELTQASILSSLGITCGIEFQNNHVDPNEKTNILALNHYINSTLLAKMTILSG